jgi:hypothetical protein
MLRAIAASAILLSTLLLATSMGQWQVDPRVGPIYPTKPYSFRSAPPGYDPFQFNWQTGRWDYVPIPYDQPAPGQAPSPYQFNWHSGRWDYRPWDAARGGNMTQPDNPPPSQPDDSQLWAPATTQPADDPPKSMSFTGRLESMRAVKLSGSGSPELLLRLRNHEGKAATVDVGSHIQLPDDPGGRNQITATGKSGEIDGCPVLFADQITIGEKTQSVMRER